MGDIHMTDNIIYFDNAATTFPKPQSVLDAAYDCTKNYCGNAGRGSHALAMRSAEIIYSAREAVASLFSASAENVIFTLNTTQSLNLAIKGIMARGGHMLISDMEHNSVLRPIARMQNERRLSYDIFPTHRNGIPMLTDEILSGIIKRLRPNTRMICAIHTSNICSYTLPVSEIGRLCRRHGLIFAVDAAQAAGHSDISLDKDSIDILCMPSHKGLYAPQGVGITVVREGLVLDTLIEGGNGVNSLELSMGKTSPERYEGGTLCTPAIAGLCAGIDFVKNIGINTVRAVECDLWRRAYSALSDIKGIELYGNESEGSTLLFNLKDIPSDELGEHLSKNGFCLRTGYHCSPLAHKALQTPTDGAVRLSFSVFNTESEVDALCRCLYEASKNIL